VTVPMNPEALIDPHVVQASIEAPKSAYSVVAKAKRVRRQRLISIG
jgi:hypothetical protein